MDSVFTASDSPEPVEVQMPDAHRVAGAKVQMVSGEYTPCTICKPHQKRVRSRSAPEHEDFQPRTMWTCAGCARREAA